jgi:hypothetical protein
MPPWQADAEHGIVMWGPPNSGKTTFLAALSHALSRQEMGWMLTGANAASEESLIRLTTSLAHDEFPSATSGIEHYRWVLAGQATRTTRRWFRATQHLEPVRIDLDLVDAAGGIFAVSKAGPSMSDALLDKLASSHGILFFYDPIREFETGDAFDYAFGMLAQLTRRMAEGPGLFDGRLAHHVAVCVTKFDEVRVLETARSLNLLTIDSEDPYGFPRVCGDDARQLFTSLSEMSRSGNGALITRLLEQYFLPERVSYFVTSSIGFYTDPRNGAFDSDDPQNVLLTEDGRVKIRGAVHPLNVVEPLLWLTAALAAKPSRSTG